ncbi:poly(A)-binding protein binding protein [Friedmanniomyces endolithicus]|nr:poly(A)-binding protein binding protein [Friedmanniomyces endolithicus]KAK0294443.1 poly(A)-binding protein binding protein [Friedmanniomyces endolithicus]KAK1017656.1 poly(A)-binding protein binding protein [Friedmanniomyces endolithicus]
MSTAAMTGPPDAAKAGHAKPQQPFKNGNAAGKALDGPRKQNGSPVDGQNRRSQQPQTKAWQGTNPITQRAAPGTTNGTEKPLPKLPPQAQNTGKQESGADRHLHDGLLFMMGNYMGHDATITLKNGERFAGVFSGGNFDSMTKSMYVLKMVRRTRSLGDAQVNGDADMSEEYLGEGEDHMMSFDAQDTLLFAVDGVIVADAPPTQNGSTTGSFRTDTEISSRQPAMQQERQLQRWDDSADTEIDMSLDSGETGWDQFATNEKLYGVRTTYDENIYTTAIDRRDPRYKQREAEAARIAHEIEGSSAANAHVAEERRRDAGKEDGRDEEEKYSGVRRESASLLPKRTAGAYVPPSHRPITGAPTVPGAPYDPAIIATSKPVPVPSQPTGPTPTIVEPVALPDRSKPTATDGKDMHVPVAASQAPRSQAESSTEDHVSKTIDAFKQFANNEKLKVRQAQEQKRAGARQEKNVKLNDLKKFAANFKLNSRVPDDLVPILAKDREKQLEIQRKADEAAKEAELTPKEKKPKELKESKEPTPGTTPPAPVSQTPVALVSDPRLQFNPNSRQRVSQQPIRGGQPLQTQAQSPRAPQPQGRNNQQYGRGTAPPLAEIRAPTGPARHTAERMPLSPMSATRFNINAMEFKPIATSFSPSGTTPSPPKRKASAAEPVKESTASFFGKGGKPIDEQDRKEAEGAFNPVKRMLDAEYAEQEKKVVAQNGGVALPFRTQPTWPGLDNTSFIANFPSRQYGGPSQGVSPMHTPNPNGAPMAHAHQLPPHMPTPHQMGTPSQRHQQYYASNSAPHGPASFDPRMQHFGPNGSVQSSPRFPHAQMAAFNSQMPPHMQQIPVPFAGGGQLMQGGIPIGISPSLQPRQMVGGPGMPPGGPQAMMMQGGGYGGGGGNGGGGQHHGRFRRGSKGQGNANGNWSGADERAGSSSVQQGPRGGGFPPGQQQFFGGGGGQQQQPHMGGAPMMAPSMSNGGGGGGVYMNGLPPQQQQGQGQGYSPMPHHAQMQHPGHGTPGPGGYAGSPRPALMAHSLSHQGFNPLQQQQQQQQHGGGGGMMQMGQQGIYGGGGGMSQQQQQQVFALGQGGAHPMHWQQRQMSSSGGGGYGGGVPAGVGMTPRPQQVTPMMQGQQQGQQGQQQHSGMPSPGPGSGGGSGASGIGGPVGGSGHGQGVEEVKGG